MKRDLYTEVSARIICELEDPAANALASAALRDWIIRSGTTVDLCHR